MMTMKMMNGLFPLLTDNEEIKLLMIFRTVMFNKRCTLSEDIGGNWQQVCMGDLQVYYDPELFTARICIISDNGEIVSNTIIGVNTVLEVSFDLVVARHLPQKTLIQLLIYRSMEKSVPGNRLSGPIQTIRIGVR